MPSSFRSRQKKENRRRRILSAILIFSIFMVAALYLYGNNVKVAIHMNSGHNYFQQGNLAQALQEFNHVLTLKANNPQAIDAIGMIYLAQGDLIQAEIKYEQAIKHGLKLHRKLNHSKIGYQYLSRGVYPQAELAFRHALAITPRDIASSMGHALSLHALGRLTEAIEGYRKTLALDPDLKLAQSKINQAREELDRDFITYMKDCNDLPLARYRVRSRFKSRHYPMAQFTAHLIGYLSENNGAMGLEKALSPYLPGNTISLTIDSEWQRTADKAMGWRKGALVALDPKTGEIKAVINHPSFNPNNLESDWNRISKNKNQPLRNRSIETLYKPGSIFKIITAAAAIESEINLENIFPVHCSGATRFNEKTFWCWKKHNQVKSLLEALDTSCNLAMAEVGFALGPDRMYEFSNKFGFGAPISMAFDSDVMDFSIPVATSMAPMANDTRYDLADRSCGLGDNIKISPLHAAMLAATIANDGVMMHPFMIKEIQNIEDKIIGKGSPRVFRTPIKPETAKILKTYMIDAVENGIGQKAQVKGFTVAGKTGTTGDSNEGLNGWFICFAPAENPQVAAAIFVEKEGTGMDMAAPIARLFLQQILK